jgi:hypothetical protein
MLAIVKAVNFALAFCHPLVLCHLKFGPFGNEVLRNGPWLAAEICHEIIEAHGRLDGAGPEVGRRSAPRVLCPRNAVAFDVHTPQTIPSASFARGHHRRAPTVHAIQIDLEARHRIDERVGRINHRANWRNFWEAFKDFFK